MSLMEAEFKLHKHAGFLFDGVVSRQRGLQPFTPDVADGRFPHKLNCHSKPIFPLRLSPSYSLGVRNQ
jgi:hypothetical protein